MATKTPWLRLGFPGALLAAVSAVVWVLSVGAAPSAQTAGTVIADDVVSSSLVLPAADRTIDIAVDDPDLNVMLFVGEGPSGEAADFHEILIRLDALGFLDTIVIDLRDPVPGIGYEIINPADIPLDGDGNVLRPVDRNGNGVITPGDFEVAEPAADDPGLAPGDTPIGADFIRPRDVATNPRVIAFEARDIIAADSVFALRYATSTRELATVAVEGDDPDGVFAVALRETEDGFSGRYVGTVVATEPAGVTINIGDVNGEQFPIPGGPAAQVYEEEEHAPGVAIADNDFFNIILRNPPIRDTATRPPGVEYNTGETCIPGGAAWWITDGSRR